MGLYVYTVVPRKTNALRHEKLAKQMGLVRVLVPHKTNVPMALLCKTNVYLPAFYLLSKPPGGF